MFSKTFWSVSCDKQEIFFKSFKKQHWQTAFEETLGNVLLPWKMWPNHQIWKGKQKQNVFQALSGRLAGASSAHSTPSTPAPPRTGFLQYELIPKRA